MPLHSNQWVLTLAGSAHFPATVLPFLLPGISLLGRESVPQPFENPGDDMIVSHEVVQLLMGRRVSASELISHSS